MLFNIFRTMILVGVITFLYFFSNLKAQNNLDVGSRCGPNNQGICTPATNCAEAVQIMKQKQNSSLEICGMIGQLEIVCCSKNKNKKSPEVPLKNSAAACLKYSKRYSINLQPFIINGENASLGEFPYMAAVGYPGNTTGEIGWECGGILISERFILTAAHCVVRDDRKLPSIVRLGKIDLLGDSDNATAQDIPVEERIIHPEYKSYKLGKDIALLRLARTAEFNDNVKAVCLNTSPQIRSRLLISGWGLINRTTEQRSRFLQRAIMEPYDLNKCNQTFLESPSRIAIYDAQLCALSNAPAPSSTCKGDSGGPIQFENRRNDGRTPMIVAGITSYGRGCRGSVPTIYTRVSSYLSWIEEIVWP